MGRSRLSPVHPYLLAALMAIIAGNSPAPAGGPLLLSQSGKPFLWPSGGTAIPFNPDQGKLGPLVNAAAVLQTVTAFSQWESIPTATATYVNAGKLPVDVNITNFAPFLFPSAPDGLSAIVYDADGSIFGLLFGGGSGVLGFAGPEWVNPATGTILEGVSFLNGGSILGGFPSSRFLDVQVHEFGHYSNLAHTVVNGQVAILGDSNGPSPFNTFPPESLFGKIETMYPFIIGGGGMATPHADDRAIFSTLYPRTGFFAEAGSISGTILSVSGEAKLSGINVIARNIADPFVDAVSAISGDFQLIPGGSGSFAGAYRLNGLTPGAEYAVFIDRILAGGFSTRPLNFASPEEFYNGAGESGDPCTDFPGEFVPLVAAAGVEETGIDIILNPFPLDFDFDGVVNQCDNCLDTPNPLQLDDDTDGRGNLCDNCAFLPNPLQEDFDTDGTGDLCDSCTDGDGDGFGDPGFPINQCEVDNCPEIGNPLQLEEDGDGFGNLCDNCPTAANFPQVDGDGNGVGDVCQPIVAIVGIDQEDGVTVRVETFILHPQGNQLMGTAAVLIPPDPVPLQNLFPALECTDLFPLGIGNGAQLAYLNIFGTALVADGAGLGCTVGTRTLMFAFGTCQAPVGGFILGALDFTGRPAPVEFCVRELTFPENARSLVIEAFDAVSLTLRDTEGRTRFRETAFVDQAIPALDISALPPGTAAEVEVSVTDGSTPPVGAIRPFLVAGESLLVFDVDAVPVAVAGGDRTAECESPAGATLLLDGSASTDADPVPGILDFEWIEDLGLATENLLGPGPSLPVLLAIGDHRITLRVTDLPGAFSTDTFLASVADTTPPEISVGLVPGLLWPPNHRLVGIDTAVGAADLCSAATAPVLGSVVSSEPDDAPGIGDGNTLDDVQGETPGSVDIRFEVRAERAGSGGGRHYAVTYVSSDGFGNQGTGTAEIFVPHDLGGVVEPVILLASETAAGTLLEWHAVPGAVFYNLVRGELKNLRETIRSIDLGPLTCLAAGITTTTTAGMEDPTLPLVGEAFFYLVEYNDGAASSFSTESAAKERIAPPGAPGCP